MKPAIKKPVAPQVSRGIKIPRLPAVIEEAAPCELKFAGVRLKLRLPGPIVEALERVNYPAILRMWGERRELTPDSVVERWERVVHQATWRKFGKLPGKPKEFTFTLFLRDWENLSRMSSDIGVTVECLVTVALLHAAAGRRDQ